ncbi:MAG: hypothetical protein GXO24_03515 [Chlorobi bacterium]|nr:hypothetical protein [Chlorobiota bacterium]
MDDQTMQDIPSPATGLLVFNTTSNAFYYFNGTEWINVGSSGQDNDWKVEGDNMYSLVSGNVGVATQTPEFPLDVNGALRHGNELYIYSESSGGSHVWASFNSPNDYGDNVVLGAGGTFIIGSGEFPYYTRQNVDMTNGHETFYIGSDYDMRLYTHMQGGWDNRIESLMMAADNTWSISPTTIYFHDTLRGNHKVRFLTRTAYHNGYGVSINPGEGLVLGGGESANRLAANVDLSSTEILYLTSDQSGTSQAIKFITSLQSSWDDRVEALTITGEGKIGIGTNSPSGHVQIAGTSNDAGPNDTGNPGADLVIGPIGGTHMEFDTNEIHAMNGTNGSTLYINADGGDISFGEHLDADADDRVNIKNIFRLVPRKAPSSPQEGDIYYDSDTHKLRVFDGTDWHDLW